MMNPWIQAARPKTLAAAVAPIAVGAAEASRVAVFEAWPVAACLAFAFLVQIGTNMSNDYFDHIKGADGADRTGPERMVASGKVAPRAMLRASVAVFAMAFLVGLSLVSLRGWELLIVGILSILLGYGYTGGPYPLAYHGLGDLFVILFFGLVATGGTYYVLSGEVDGPVLLLGGSLGLLANNILVVNNYRDVESDRRAGKMTLVARFGRRFGVAQYSLQFVGAIALVAVHYYYVRNPWVFLVCATLPLGWRTSQVLGRTHGEALNRLLGRSALILLLVGGTLAVAIAAGG